MAVNPLGGARLKEPLVFHLQHPVRHQFRTYSSLTFRRRASADDVQVASRIADPRKTASVVLARLAKVPKAVIDKMAEQDLLDLMAGTNDLFKLEGVE